MFSFTACEGMSVSTKRYDEISNYVLENIDTLSPEKEIEFAKLHIFYDTPTWNGKAWYCAREMCEVQNYMFPEIKCGECFEFNSVKI